MLSRGPAIIKLVKIAVNIPAELNYVSIEKMGKKRLEKAAPSWYNYFVSRTPQI
jgi:hypothetical protein